MMAVEVNVAISYGGRREIVDAVKSYSMRKRPLVTPLRMHKRS